MEHRQAQFWLAIQVVGFRHIFTKWFDYFVCFVEPACSSNMTGSLTFPIDQTPTVPYTIMSPPVARNPGLLST